MESHNKLIDAMGEVLTATLGGAGIRFVLIAGWSDGQGGSEMTMAANLSEEGVNVVLRDALEQKRVQVGDRLVEKH